MIAIRLLLTQSLECAHVCIVDVVVGGGLELQGHIITTLPFSESGKNLECVCQWKTQHRSRPYDTAVATSATIAAGTSGSERVGSGWLE